MAIEFAEFSINTTGTATGQSFAGKFKIRKHLSFNGHLERDQIRRRLLGKDPENASPRAIQISVIFSTVLPHIVDAPSWWKDSDNGMELEDSEPAVEVFNEVVKLTNTLDAAKLKEGQEAQERLKAQVEAKKE